MSIGDIFLDLKLNTRTFDNQIKGIGSYAQKSIGSAFGGVGKVIAGALSTAAIVSFGKSCIDLGSDLAEVQNVVDVTFPHMTAQVDEFAKNAINQFGLSETVAKRMTGTYGAMAKAFGFSEKASYDMATSLTGLAGDVASFYNLDPTEAYTKLKSVFSGETETLKDLGIVMTQNALDQYAMANGFGKTTAKMSEQEKVMLRMQFVTQQLSAASGDFVRTSDSWANKVRVLSLNFQSLKATIGQGLINVLSPLVSLLNNIIVKLQKAAQYFVAFVSLITGNKKTSSTLGSVSSNVDKISSGLGGASSGASNLADKVTGAGKAAKKAAKEMGALASFDDIKNLKSSSSSNDGGSGGSSGGGGTGGFGDDMNIGGETEEAIDIDTSGMEKGIQKMKQLWNNFTNFLTNKKEVIISLIAGIAAGFIAFETIKNWGKVTSGISMLIEPLKRIVDMFKMLSMYPNLVTTQLFGISAASTAVVVGVAAITAALVYLYQTSETFRNMVNEALLNIFTILNNLWVSILQPLFMFLADVFTTILVPLATFLAKTFVKAVEAIATIILSLWNNILAPLVNFIVDVLGIALQGLIDIWLVWKPKIEEIFDALMWVWDNALAPLVDFIVGKFCDGFKAWGELIDRLIPPIKAMFQGLVDFFVGIFTKDMEKAWSGITSIFKGFDAFLTNIFKTDWTKTLGALGAPLNALCSTLKSIWNTIKGVFNGIIQFVTGVFTGNWKKAWQGVKNIFSSIISGIANIFKAPINAIISGINTFIGGLNKIKIPDWVPGVGGYGINIPKIPKLAQGGYVKANTPQLAMIGDNRTQGEIVSPEGKMFEIMMSALKTYGQQNTGNQDIQIIVSILYEIIEAIKNIQLVVDGDSLNNDSKTRDKERALRTGKMIIG